jgi:predicted dehydrogenase
MITLGQVRLGYWGPNLLRTLQALPGAGVKAVCDLDEGALARVAAQHPTLIRTGDYQTLLDDPRIGAIVVTSPAMTHYPLSRAAFEAGKHVFGEAYFSTSG